VLAPISAREEENNGGGGSGGDLPPAVDPIIAGSLKRLPKSGYAWPQRQRKLWLQLLEGSFDLIYFDKDETAEGPRQGQSIKGLMKRRDRQLGRQAFIAILSRNVLGYAAP